MRILASGYREKADALGEASSTGMVRFGVVKIGFGSLTPASGAFVLSSSGNAGAGTVPRSVLLMATSPTT